MELKFKIAGINQIESHFTLNPDFRPAKDKHIEINYGVNISLEIKENKLISTLDKKQLRLIYFKEDR